VRFGKRAKRPETRKVINSVDSCSVSKRVNVREHCQLKFDY
jgi:hypothetical protein